ncbi:MAG: endolytic transglycosylase MltG [Bdellovibrionaceae bacterium]|nr:endolytic transglycosylase MltG [Pseudobdellovibrionaceae bacterium]
MRTLKYVVLITVLALSLVSWLGYQYFQKPLPMPAYRIISVKAGDSLRSIGNDLYDKEVISTVEEFLVWGRVFGHHKFIRTGEYGIPVGITMNQLYAILKSGKSLGYRISIPEGSNTLEIAQRLEELQLCTAKDFLKVVHDKKFIQSSLGENVPTLEGYLFPDTYFFTKIDGAKVIARKLVQRFKDKTAHIEIPAGWSRHQAVTLASIIEKETGAPEERPLISSVFHNRLNKQMKLQTDPTVIYAKYLQTGIYEMKISRDDLMMMHPYNTYRIKALPPGPISNPGAEAIEAAINPAQSNYIFFVSRNDGTHVFTTEYKDHVKAVSSFQLNSKAREGKSWRDLKKRPKTATQK